jgi:hypothetical protein
MTYIYVEVAYPPRNIRGPFAKSVDSTLLLRTGTLWRCGDGLFFEAPPLASDALLTTFHPLLENALQIVRRRLQEDSGTGGFLTSELHFHGWKSPKIAWGEIWTP